MDEKLQRDPSVENKLKAGDVVETLRSWVVRRETSQGSEWLAWSAGNGYGWSKTIMDCLRYDSKEKCYITAHTHAPPEAHMVEVETIVVEVSSQPMEVRRKEIERTRLQEEISKLQRKLDSLL